MSTKKTKIKKSDKNNIISKTTLNEEESTVNI